MRYRHLDLNLLVALDAILAERSITRAAAKALAVSIRAIMLQIDNVIATDPKFDPRSPRGGGRAAPEVIMPIDPRQLANRCSCR
jgi:hypothetical protein